MTYVTVSEADAHLGHLTAWTALDDDAKERCRVVAGLWVNYSYEWPGKIASCPVPYVEVGQMYPYVYPQVFTTAEIRTTVQPAWPRVNACGGAVKNMETGCDISGVPDEVRLAQIYAMEASLTVPLFSTPTFEEGGLTEKTVKAGSVSITRRWQEATRGSVGEIELPNVTAVLLGIGTRRGSKTGRMIPVF